MWSMVQNDANISSTLFEREAIQGWRTSNFRHVISCILSFLLEIKLVCRKTYWFNKRFGFLVCLQTFFFGIFHQTMHILSCLLENTCVPNEHDVNSIVIKNTLLVSMTIVIIVHSCCCLSVCISSRSRASALLFVVPEFVCPCSLFIIVCHIFETSNDHLLTLNVKW